MGLDMYLYRATKDQVRRLDELTRQDDELNEKWNPIFKKEFPDQWWNLSDEDYTPRQKELMNEFRQESHRISDDRHEICCQMNGKMCDDFNLGEIAYWRKFNALHGYIVDTFADGVDECQKIPLTKENIQKTLEDLKKVREVLDASEKVNNAKYPNNYTFNLPKDATLAIQPRAGFFFGETTIDSWFERDVNSAIEVFTQLIDEWDDDQEVWYEASW